MRKWIAALSVALPLAVFAASGPQTLVNETGLTFNNQYQQNLTSYGNPQSSVGKLSAQVTVSSANFVTGTFSDGAQGTGTITVNSNNILAVAATNQITVPASVLAKSATAQIVIVSTTNLGSPASSSFTFTSVTNLPGQTISIAGNAGNAFLTAGVDFPVGPTTSDTAKSVRDVINNNPNLGLTASFANSTVFATTTINTVGTGYSIATSSTFLVNISIFKGGVANAVLTINGVQLRNGTEWNAGATTALTGTSLSNAINTVMASSLVSNSVFLSSTIFTTATASGFGGNGFTLTSSIPASISTGTLSQPFNGGAPAPLYDQSITFNGTTYPNGGSWTDGSGTSSGTALSIATWLNGFTGQLTATALSNSGKASTSTIVVASTTNLNGASLILVGASTVTLTNGVHWFAVGNASMTALSLAQAINSVSGYTNIVASAPSGSATIFTTATASGVFANVYTASATVPLSISTIPFAGGVDPTFGSVVFATAAVKGLAGNAFTLKASTSNLVIPSPTFTAGQDNATVIVNNVTFTAGVSFSTGSTAATATNLAAAINNSSATTGVNAAAGSGSTNVVFATGIVSGFAPTIQSSTDTALTLSGPKFVNGSISTTTLMGATTPSYSLNSQIINIPNHGFTKGLQVLYSTSTGVGITNLLYGTTFFVVVVDANNVKLSSTSAVALVGNGLVLASSISANTARSFTLAPLPFVQGFTSAKWEVSNDGTNWASLTTTAQGVAISTDSFTPVFPSSTTVKDFGPLDYGFIRYNVIAPTQGGLQMKVILNGKD